METAPLKLFATAARSELIREVGARITAVLAEGSPERVEQPKAVSGLVRAIARAGGGDRGKEHVADRVAYTWFNRIVALRFMDANGYTGIGVVSPAADQVGQPDVLAAAKRGQIDADVVRGISPAIVTGLLNGTRQPRRGADAQAEAYALLLADYCRFWNAAMPFMFEREGDYTELLIPANLLAEDSVLSRSVAVLSQDVCQDVEVIGWLYQFYISDRKDEVFAGFKKNRKAGADEIPAATQLFTPHWIVRYLVENSLGRLWLLNHPTSELIRHMEYYIAPAVDEHEFLKISRPEELKIIDPACGSGHMLTYAFDLLYAIYEEEGYAPSEIPGLILDNNLYGTEIDPRAGALAAFALTMKAVARRKLFLKNPIEPNIRVIDPISFSPHELTYLVTSDGDRYAEEAFWNQFAEADTFGSLITPDPDLITRLARHLETVTDDGDMYKADALDWARQAITQAELLSRRYSVLVANPPYMGSANMGATLAEFAKRSYPLAKADLMTMFMQRAQELVVRNGAWGMVNLPSWMFLSSYRGLRRWLLDTARLTSLLHLGRGVFGSDFGSVAFVVDNAPPSVSTVGVYRRLFDEHVQVRSNAAIEARFLDSGRGRFDVAQDSLRSLPETPIAYWLDNSRIRLLADVESLGEVANIAAGISTGSNDRFFRFWQEVSYEKVRRGDAAGDWAPHHKGGPARKWYGNVAHVLHYSPASVAAMSEFPGFRHDGEASYFLPHIGWSALTSGRPSFRFIPSGHTFGSGSKAILASRETLLASLGLLNSNLALELLQALSPTMNFEVGHIGRLPLPSVSLQRDLPPLVEAAIGIARTDWDEFEESMDFQRMPLVARGPGLLPQLATRWDEDRLNRASRLERIEADIEALVRAEYEVEHDEAEPMGEGEATLLGQSLTPFEVSQSLISYSVGCMFGRYSLDDPGLILANQGATFQDYLAKVSTPVFEPDADNVIPIVDGDWFEDDIVGLFRRFLRTAFGDQHFEENLKFVTESLGVRNLRDYFITRSGRSKFYDDHVQRYKKRPIYWLFSSPKGSFNALIYMHRYTPSTVSTVLTYLREYVTKLESSLQQAERAGNAKEADRLRKILVELNEYEHDTLYPKASENVVIDLDDGVKLNYPRFGRALKKITGLEASDD